MHGSFGLSAWGRTWRAANSAGHPAAAVGLSRDGVSKEMWGQWFFGPPGPRGSAALWLQPAFYAEGQTPAVAIAVGAAVLALSLAATVEGASLSEGWATLAARIAWTPAGDRQPLAQAVLALRLAERLETRTPPPGASLEFLGPHPLVIRGRALAGYHRPLSGEVASLTATVPRAELFPEWLTSPPLGQACRVDHDGVPVMSGTLYSVRVTATEIELRIEG